METNRRWTRDVWCGVTAMKHWPVGSDDVVVMVVRKGGCCQSLDWVIVRISDFSCHCTFSSPWVSVNYFSLLTTYWEKYRTQKCAWLPLLWMRENRIRWREWVSSQPQARMKRATITLRFHQLQLAIYLRLCKHCQTATCSDQKEVITSEFFFFWKGLGRVCAENFQGIKFLCMKSLYWLFVSVTSLSHLSP